MSELIITNGDSAGELLQAAGIGNEILPWRDVLHEGPVPETEDLAALSALRAQYLADAGFGKLQELRTEFIKRDAMLARNEDFDDVTLWFEHDLYDQLQVLQILDWFAANWRNDGRVFFVQADNYLGLQTPDTIGRFAKLRKPVTGLQLSIAKVAWSAFRHKTPEPWTALLEEDLSALPFLKAAVLRMLEELPAPQSGLTRSEHDTLKFISTGMHKPAELFAETGIFSGEPVFRGDTSYFAILDGLIDAETPLIEGRDGPRWNPLGMSKAEHRHYQASQIILTDFGQDVLAGKADHATTNGIDRWWGGTRLTVGNLWRWDRSVSRLIAPMPA